MALLMLIGLFLMSFLPKHTIAHIRPMCLSQFALASQACVVLPLTETPKDLNATKLQLADDNDDDDDGDDDEGGGDDVNEREHRHGRPGNGNGRNQRRGNGNGHRQSRGNGNGNGHRQRREHGHNHTQRHEHSHGHGGDHRDEPRANRDCCRWLEEVDVSCVCAALHSLPPFLVKPDHQYRVKVGNTCALTFRCSGV